VPFSVAISYGSCGVLKTPLETQGFNADRLVVSEDAFPSPQGPELAVDAARKVMLRIFWASSRAREDGFHKTN
jgi:hypothetical protein